jgi:hypothetical protein
MAWKIPGTGIPRCLSAFGWSLALSGALSLAPSPAAAAPSRAKSRANAASVSARPARTTPPGAASVSAASARPAPVKARAGSKPKLEAAAAPLGTTSPATKPAAPTPAEAAVAAPGARPASDVVKTEEARAGEKTYTFGAQEVEGRLKSPQILYFLRRVRAQFDPAPLGHRSFLLELADTRRHPAVR